MVVFYVYIQKFSEIFKWWKTGQKNDFFTRESVDNNKKTLFDEPFTL